MVTIAEIEKLALDLPENERALLATHLLGSLSSAFDDTDEGVEEAMRRDAVIDANPALGLSLEQFDQHIARRHI